MTDQDQDNRGVWVPRVRAALERNIAKLADRQKRGVIQGDGDR